MRIANLKFLLLFAVSLALLSFSVSATSCTNNYPGNALGPGGCSGSVTYTTNTQLVGEVNVSQDVIISSGVTLTTNGMIVIAGNMISNLGTIAAGTNSLSANPCTSASPCSQYPSSYGGSGAAGGSTSTNGGNGATPSAPSVSNALIQTWYNGGVYGSFTKYLAAAGGGIGNGATSAYAGGSTLATGGNSIGNSGGTIGGAGGAGAFGVYLQAAYLYPNTLTASGGAGGTSDSTGGGGGGGGAVVLAYGTTLGSTSGISYAGGTGGSGTFNSINGGVGGAGQLATYQYSVQPLATLSPPAVLNINPNPAAYGTQVQIVMTVSPNTDGSNIIFQGSTVLTGTGAITYNALGTPIAMSNALAPGTYTVNGCDTTSNICAGNTILTVSTANVPITCTRNGQSIAAGALYNSLLANALTSCTFQSLGNQIIGNIIRNGADLVSGSAPSTTQDWDNQLNAWVANTFATGNYASNSLSWSVNDIPYSLLSATLPAAQGYETQAQSLSYDINFTKAAANVLVTFGVNGIVAATNSVSVASTDQVFPFSYTNPLVAANNIMQSVFTVNALLHFGGSFASYDPILTPALNTLTQNVLWNYYPQLSSISPSPAIQGDNITVNMLISQVNPLSAVSVAGNLKVGNQTLTEAVTSAYHYQTVMHSFVNSHYALPMPTVGTPVTVGANAIFQLTYNGVTLYRNASESTFSTYLESLGTCGTTNYATNTLLWTFYNGTKPSKVWTPNVLLSGFYTIVRNLYQSNAISGTSAGFTSTATSNTYETCIYPSWAKFNVSATANYNSTNTVLSNYYLNQLPLSNTLTTLQLYLNLEPNPIQYEIFVQNGSTLNYIPALVKVLLYNVNTNSSTLVNELKTQANSGVFTLLNNQSFYQFQAFTPDGKTLLATTKYYQAVPCSTAACEFTIVVGNFNVTLPSTVFKNVQSGCTTVAGSGNTMTVSCTFTSLNGATYNTSLNVTYGQVLNHASVCEKSVVSGSASLDCTVSNTNSTQYYYAYSLYYGGTWYVLAHGYVGLQASLFGQDGAWFALLVVETLVLLFLSRNVTFAIVLFDVGFVLVSLVGLVYVPLTILGFELAASAVVLYVANRGVG